MLMEKRLDPNSSASVSVLPTGGADATPLAKPNFYSVANYPTEKMPFRIAPVIPYLRMYDQAQKTNVAAQK